MTTENVLKPLINTVIKADFSDADAIKLMRDYTSLCKRAGVVSVVIISVTSDNHIDFITHFDNEHHAAVTGLALDEVRKDIDNLVFGGEPDLG